MAEHLEITLSDGTAEAYLGGTEGPRVLFFMDAIGLRPQIERMVDRIASWGYVVLAPNVFWRDGRVADLAPQADLRDPDAREAFFATGVMDRVRGLTPDLCAADLDSWVATLKGADGIAPGPIAAVGYCFGGRLALLAAAERPDDVVLAGLFHTGGLVTEAEDSPHLRVPGVRAFVLAGHADHDRSNTPEQVAAFDAALDAAGVRRRTAIYPDAPHGYSMADTSSYQEAGAERHFDELRAALSAELA